MLIRGVERRAIMTGAGCALLLVVVYLLAVWTATGQRFEDTVLTAAVGGRGDGQNVQSVQDMRDIAIDALGAIQFWSFGLAVVVISALGRLRGGPVLGYVVGGMIVAALLVTEILQYTLPRPVLLPSGFRREDQSFPSGHAAIGMSVTCGLLMVVPYRLRGAVAVLASVGAAGVAALTVTVSWHRPSDTVGSALIVLLCVCAAMVLLARFGLAGRPEEGPGMVARRPIIATLGAGVALAVVIALAAGGRVMYELARSPDPDLAPHAALTAGRAIALAAGGLLVLAVLALLRHVDLRPRGGGVRPEAGGRVRAAGQTQPSGPTVDVTR